MPDNAERSGPGDEKSLWDSESPIRKQAGSMLWLLLLAVGSWLIPLLLVLYFKGP